MTKKARGNETVDLEMRLHHETDLAIKVSLTGTNAVWLPKSQIEFERTGRTCAVTMTMDLAIEKGLV